MSNPKVVLVVGGSGQLGTCIVHAILAKNPTVHIRVLGRNVDNLLVQSSNGRVTFIVGDLTNPQYDLAPALAGVDAVVSSIIGDQKVTVDGQFRLIDAAKAAGVKQFIPSAFSSEYKDVPQGLNPNWDMRRAVDSYLEKSGVPYTIINQGGFPETMFIPGFLPLLDLPNKKVFYWGDDKSIKIPITTYADTGKIVAETLWDSWALNRRVHAYGNLLTVDEIAAIFKEVTGQGEVVRSGSLAELDAKIQGFVASGNFMAAIPFMYTMGFFMYPASSDHPTHYHDKIKFTTFKEALAGCYANPQAWILAPKSMPKKK